MNYYITGYYTNMEIYNTDCLEDQGLCKLADKSIDMILCDPPYAITANKWDKPLDLEKMFKEYDRIIKDNGAIVLFGNQPFTTDLINAYRKNFRYSLVWDKNQGTDFFNCSRKPLKSHEDIIVFYKNKPTYNPQMEEGKPYCNVRKPIDIPYMQDRSFRFSELIENKDGARFPKTVLKFKRETGKHTTQKPVKLCEWLIKTYTNEGETVLDNTMGSGTTGVACMNSGRKFIGFELDEKYFEVASSRIKQAQKHSDGEAL